MHHRTAVLYESLADWPKYKAAKQGLQSRTPQRSYLISRVLLISIAQNIIDINLTYKILLKFPQIMASYTL